MDSQLSAYDLIAAEEANDSPTPIWPLVLLVLSSLMLLSFLKSERDFYARLQKNGTDTDRNGSNDGA